MYSTDLSQISLVAFEETLLTVDLLPSRRALADHISAVVPRLEELGVEHLEDLRKLLADKRGHEQLAGELAADPEYVRLLNREVNSYRSKPLPLAKLDVFTEGELERLVAVGIRSTKDLYERTGLPAQRSALLRVGLDGRRLLAALELSNLVRINGVGPSFARFFRDLGMCGPEDVLEMETREIIARYEESVADNPDQPKLRVEDIEYCKRFARWLSEDIVW